MSRAVYIPQAETPRIDWIERALFSVHSIAAITALCMFGAFVCSAAVWFGGPL